MPQLQASPADAHQIHAITPAPVVLSGAVRPRRGFLACLLLTGFTSAALLPAGIRAASDTASRPSPVMLANVYRAGMPLDDYWVSEKYDGVRGYWDGRRLLTRGGQAIAAPAWFTARWPDHAMDGELWAGRGRFQKAVSTVRQDKADDAAWREMRFMVFDLPAEPGPFTRRIPALIAAVTRIDQPWVRAVQQSHVTSHAALESTMKKIVKDGGEGVMLHRGASLYTATRNDDLLKYKPFDDAEARVLAHLPGKGGFEGRMGALLVEMPAAPGQPARRFKLGTGFSADQRSAPPPVGSTVTFRHRGFNDGGLPRFASFLRLREDN